MVTGTNGSLPGRRGGSILAAHANLKKRQAVTPAVPYAVIRQRGARRNLDRLHPGSTLVLQVATTGRRIAVRVTGIFRRSSGSRSSSSRSGCCRCCPRRKTWACRCGWPGWTRRRGIRSIAHGEGSTAIVATHDNALIELADRVLELKDGRLTGDHVAEAPA
jgi:hypothetical protein